jgi:hypothetical protein
MLSLALRTCSVIAISRVARRERKQIHQSDLSAQQAQQD